MKSQMRIFAILVVAWPLMAVADASHEAPEYSVADASTAEVRTTAASKASSVGSIDLRNWRSFLARQTKPVFIEFSASWCHSCREFAPYFEAAAKKYSSQAVFVKVDIRKLDSDDMMRNFGVTSIPATFAWVKGKAISRDLFLTPREQQAIALYKQGKEKEAQRLMGNRGPSYGYFDVRVGQIIRRATKNP